jgi:hypothetical protein
MTTLPLQRRLEALERALLPKLDIAAVLGRERIRCRSMTLAQQEVEREGKLGHLHARHAERPLQGIELAVMQGLERVLSPRAAA